MTYKNEFPDFDYSIPNLGKGWEDNSWHNDVCPSMDYDLGGERMIRIWFDYADPEMRECGADGKRYALAIGEYCGLEPLLNSDDLGEILAYIDTNKLKEANPLEFNLVVEIDPNQVAEYLKDNPTKTMAELKGELGNACYLGLDCIDAIMSRQFGFGAGNTYVKKEG